METSETKTAYTIEMIIGDCVWKQFKKMENASGFSNDVLDHIWMNLSRPINFGTQIFNNMSVRNINNNF